jgi:hypothetical protein
MSFSEEKTVVTTIIVPYSSKLLLLVLLSMIKEVFSSLFISEKIGF